MEGCERTQALARTLPMEGASVRRAPYTMAQAVAVSKALLAYYQDEPKGCYVNLPSTFGQALVLYPLQEAEQRARALDGIVSILRDSPAPATARYLFDADLAVVRWGLRIEPNPTVLLGWIYVATFSDTNGIEDALLDLAEDGATSQIRAGAITALVHAMPDGVVRAYRPGLTALANQASRAGDSSVRQAGLQLLARLYSLQSGTPDAGTPPAPPTRPRPSVPPTSTPEQAWPHLPVVLALGAATTIVAVAWTSRRSRRRGTRSSATSPRRST